ncbi:MAG: hypothetical protein HOW73_44630 [Polyangiaceae bacterium]|nr:hypothetical protein [Polyangiaceae bacterium]
MPGTIVQDEPPRDTDVDPGADDAASKTIVDDPRSEPRSGGTPTSGSRATRDTMPDPIATEPVRATLPDIDPNASEEDAEAQQPEGEQSPGDGAPAPAPKRRNVLFFVIGGLLFVALAGPLVFYFLVWRYRPTAPQHIPAGTTLAVRFDGRELYLYEPFRKHVIGSIDGSDKAKSRLDRIKKHTGVDLRNEVREIVFATMNAESWIVLVGGNFDAGRARKKFVPGLKTFLEEEGVQGYTVEDGVLKGPVLRIAQADDTTILIANNDEILRAATDPSDAWQELGLASSGAMSFVIDRGAFDAVSKNPSEKVSGVLPPALAIGALALVTPETLDHVSDASKSTQKMTGYLDLGKGPKIMADIVPTTGTTPGALSDKWQTVQTDAQGMRDVLTSFYSAGLAPAMLDAKLKPRNETVMVTIQWERKELDAGLEKLGEKIRETLGE